LERVLKNKLLRLLQEVKFLRIVRMNNVRRKFQNAAAIKRVGQYRGPLAQRQRQVLVNMPPEKEKSPALKLPPPNDTPTFVMAPPLQIRVPADAKPKS